MFNIKRAFKTAVCSVFDNSPANFEYHRQHFDTSLFCRQYYETIKLYKQSIKDYNQATNNMDFCANFDDLFCEYVDFLKQVYIHCNPMYSALNQIIITKLSEKLIQRIEFTKLCCSTYSITDKNTEDILYAREVIQKDLTDILVKTKYCIAKEREEIYKEINKIGHYYTFKRRFFSFIKFTVIYSVIILTAKYGFVALRIMCDGGDPFFYITYPIKQYLDIF